jgi:hypothetical protein
MKAIKTLVLLGIIFLCGVFIYAKFSSVGADDNYFNTHFRGQLAKYPVLRKILSLHYDGDSRSDYLGSRFSKISIEVDALSDASIDRDLLDRFTQAVGDITGKRASYYISDSSIPVFDVFNDGIVRQIVDQYHHPTIESDTANLYVLFLTQKEDDTKQLGSTYQDYGIVIDQKSLQDFTQDSPVTLQTYEYSTMLHEFGHQLGLGHNNEPGCLMNPSAEMSHEAKANPDLVVTDFCDLEKQQIAAQKLQAN